MRDEYQDVKQAVNCASQKRERERERKQEI